MGIVVGLVATIYLASGGGATSGNHMMLLSSNNSNSNNNDEAAAASAAAGEISLLRSNGGNGGGVGGGVGSGGGDGNGGQEHLSSISVVTNTFVEEDGGREDCRKTYCPNGDDTSKENCESSRCYW